MQTRRRDETGDTLVEIVIALVIIGIVVGSFFAAITTSASASKAQKDFVTADAVLRNYAEATKQEVRSPSCSTSGTPLDTSGYPAVPSGFSVLAAQPGGNVPVCPAVTSVERIDITATLPSGNQQHLSIAVRAP